MESAAVGTGVRHNDGGLSTDDIGESVVRSLDSSDHRGDSAVHIGDSVVANVDNVDGAGPSVVAIGVSAIDAASSTIDTGLSVADIDASAVFRSAAAVNSADSVLSKRRDANGIGDSAVAPGDAAADGVGPPLFRVDPIDDIDDGHDDTAFSARVIPDSVTDTGVSVHTHN